MIIKKIVIFSLLFLCTEGAVTEEEYALMPQLFYLDDFDRCLMLGKNALYCTVTVQLEPTKLANSTVWKIIEEVSSRKKNFRHDWLRHGICVPLSCPGMGQNLSTYLSNDQLLQQGVEECYSEKFKDMGLTAFVTQLHCETEKPFYGIDINDIVVGICLMVLVAVVTFASFYEGTARYKSQEYYNQITTSTCGKIITCFSIPNNWDRLKSKYSGPDAHALRCITGMRFYTIVLVIIAHTCMISFATFSSNPQFSETMTSEPMNMLFINGNYSMETFLLMSGWLLSYHFFLTFEKQNFKVSYIILAFINRYIRLTTCLAVVIALNATWIQHINRGPLWDKTVGEEYRNCRKNWWVNLLYINNYYDVKHMCLLQTWYLATDTQLFLFSIMVLAVIWKNKKYVVSILATCLTIGILITGVLNYTYNYDIIVREQPESMYNILLDVPEWTNMLIPGHTHIGGYTIGLIAGYLFYKTRGKLVIVKTYHIVLWWIVTWTFPLSIIFLGVLFYNDNYEYSRLGAAIYAALARNIFAVGLATAIFGVSQNVGWLLRDAILWPPLQVLGRLTYCVFLVHVALIRIRFGQARSLSYMTSYTFIFQSCADLMLSFTFALILCLFVEMPTSALQKLMVPQLAKKRSDGLLNDYPSRDINKMSEKQVTRI